MRKFLLLLTIIPTSLSASPAQSATACTKVNVGIVECMAERMCECIYHRESKMAGTPAHFGWDCGNTRPNCLDYKNINAGGQPAYNGPSAVGISNSNTDINQNQAQDPDINVNPTLTQQQQSPTTTQTQTPTQTQTQTGTQTNTQTQNSTQTDN